jgi:hypothetical protein
MLFPKQNEVKDIVLVVPSIVPQSNNNNFTLNSLTIDYIEN